MMTANDHQFLLNHRQHDVLTEIELMEIICIIAIKEENASFINQLVDAVTNVDNLDRSFVPLSLHYIRLNTKYLKP
jgi:hypothetical protein